MLNKILTIENIPDVFVCDLEDSVPFDEKMNARMEVSSFIKTEWKNYIKNINNYSLMIPRINNTKDLLEDDLNEICSEYIDVKKLIIIKLFKFSRE
jgi:citrate lyase beta subunit